MSRRALITGITGQDGAYLSELLLGKGYELHGIMRRASTFSTERIDHLYRDPHSPERRLILHYGDLADAIALRRIVDTVQPDEVYNLAAQSHVKVSFSQANYTGDIVALGALRLLEAVRDHSAATGRPVRFYQAGSSEMFGASPAPQSEVTPFYPRSPYAVSKLAAHWFTVNFREAYGMYACNGILFNHESPRRGETFVTRKITRALGRIKLGLQDRLFLGNLDARRDWGFAGDYVTAMWAMLQQEKPDDYVVATGQSHSIREFLDAAAGHLGLDWHDYVVVDPSFFRPTEVEHLRGDATRAETILGWKPTVSFEQLVKMMTEHDLELAGREKLMKDSGRHIERAWLSHD